MAPILSGLATGVLFAVGLALGGMTQPGKVIAFLDVTGHWDPSLALVMGGAIAVYAPAYRQLVSGSTPLFADSYVVPSSRRIDAPLVTGAVLFGIGWGIAGYCPGPAIVAVGTGAPKALWFGAAMLFGMVAFDVWQRMRIRKLTAGQPAAA